ncbi:MAG: dual specificity protein phosphatase family protein [Sedimentisphaerales bacterium]|nr:dual specificity protein phosphatase family protein [Sedimentisphaerales bacterium]
MKKKKNSFLIWLWTIVIILAGTSLVRHFRIKNFHTIVPEVLYTSGQPRGMDYTRLLYKYHIATFVNVRDADEHRERNWYNEEITWMRDNGANYIELPIEKHGQFQGIPDSQTVEKFLKIMADSKNLPVLVHDSSGRKRVSYLAAAWMLRTKTSNIEHTIEKVKQIKDEALTTKEMEFLQRQAR